MVASREHTREGGHAQAWTKTMTPPTTAAWVDANMGCRDQLVIRSSWVARELKAKAPALSAAELFSAMPPSEALKPLLSLMATLKASNDGDDLMLGFDAVSRALWEGGASEFLAAP